MRQLPGNTKPQELGEKKDGESVLFFAMGSGHQAAPTIPQLIYSE
jgi:hypothetical protein